jgi:Flp pilus assembly protein TadD
MKSQNNLETIGNLRINPLDELLIEIAQNSLNGSLRISNTAQKIAVYFDTGETVFAASNARQHRFYELLLQTGKITRERLAAIPDYANDLALKENLLKDNLLEKKDIEQFFSRQISEIVKTALSWREAEWKFSPLVRVKGDIRFFVDTPNTLIEYARSLPAEEVARKFKDPRESLRVKTPVPAGVRLSPAESFVFSRFEKTVTTIEEIETLSSQTDAETRRILYALWLGGLLVREITNPAFSERKLSAMSAARISLIKDDVPPVAQPAIQFTKTKATETEANAGEQAPREREISAEEYLTRVEKAANFYELFALAPGADAAEIKRTYFSLAKRFHPDLYHKETDAKLLQRIHTAFSELARAYETLRNDGLRKAYDIRVLKESEEMIAVQKAGMTPEELGLQKQSDQAAENFERGFDFLTNENYNAAVPHLARAVHLAEDNARYHAFYGKALLMMDERQRHKAEAELQIAVRLDDREAEYKIMLAELYVRFGLFKRAESELKRLLTIHPNDREARTLLDSLLKK